MVNSESKQLLTKINLKIRWFNNFATFLNTGWEGGMMMLIINIVQQVLKQDVRIHFGSRLVGQNSFREILVYTKIFPTRPKIFCKIFPCQRSYIILIVQRIIIG